MTMMKAEGAQGGAAAAAAANWSELYDDLLHQMVTNYYDNDDDDRMIINLPSKLPVLLVPNTQTSVSPAVIAARQQQEVLDRLFWGSAPPELGSDEEDEYEKRDVSRYYNPNDKLWVGEDITRLEKPSRTIYSLYSRKVHTHIQLHVPHYFNCRGSSHGWLVAVREDDNLSIRLLNPFRSVDNEIQLPPLTTIGVETLVDHPKYGSHHIWKAYVSENPSSVSNPSDLVVMITYEHYRPAFCRPGDASWTWYVGNDIWKRGFVVHDAVYYKGQFYATCVNRLWLIAFDVSHFHHNIPPKITMVADELKLYNITAPVKYLVECGGDLLQVRRDTREHNDGSGYKTYGFDVLKLILSSPSESNDNNSYKWVKVNTLDGYSLFLGVNGSMSVLASNYPPGCCKPNCIYFTDDYEGRFVTTPSQGPNDMGVFSLEDGSFEPHYQFECKNFTMPNAIWIQPML